MSIPHRTCGTCAHFVQDRRNTVYGQCAWPLPNITWPMAYCRTPIVMPLLVGDKTDAAECKCYTSAQSEPKDDTS
jgi:hypothetical protein